MTNKQRVHAALAGEPVDRAPVTALYSFLYQLDHFTELTGRPAWRAHWWQQAPPAEHVAVLAQMLAAAPFETIQPWSAPPRSIREKTRYFEKDGQAFWERDGQAQPVVAAASGHATDYVANETPNVFTHQDADEKIRVIAAEEQRATGVDDYLDAVVQRFGQDQFIIAGGVVGTIYACATHLGQTNTLCQLIENPGLVEYVCHKITEQNVAIIRRLAMAGGDAIYIDDATATSDMISVAHYERFSLPYLKQMVREIHRVGHQAILIYFGGIADRLEQIASIGADGLSCETSMKGYVNDIASIARQIGDRVTVFGNIDPVGVLQDGGEPDLEAAIRHQIEDGRAARGFITCTGSPITPATPLARVQRFLDGGRRYGRQLGKARTGG